MAPEALGGVDKRDAGSWASDRAGSRLVGGYQTTAGGGEGDGSQLPEAVTPFDPSNVETRTELAAALDALRLPEGAARRHRRRPQLAADDRGTASVRNVEIVCRRHAKTDPGAATEF